MQTNQATFSPEQSALFQRLEQSRTQLLAQARSGELDTNQLYQLANTVAHATSSLLPLPLDPAKQLLAAHAHAHPYLERLPRHDPAHVVIADETHSYTPRKILRRILDHALDHVNQIEQWLLWLQQGSVPTPTDGWATSASPGRISKPILV